MLATNAGWSSWSLAIVPPFHLAGISWTQISRLVLSCVFIVCEQYRVGLRYVGSGCLAMQCHPWAIYRAGLCGQKPTVKWSIYIRRA